MKQMKMLEKELTKIDGMKTLLEQKRLMIESTPLGGQVYSDLKEVSAAIEKLN